MIFLVTGENRGEFYRELTEMHRQRKRVFVDQLGWQLECAEGLETDEFDGPEAIYLLLVERDELLASARMLQTDRPHLLGSVFPYLCPDGVPTGQTIWESTRFCPSPDVLDPAEKRRLLGVMIAGMIEAALLFGVDQITFVAGGALKPVALAAGWAAKPLGPTIKSRGDRLTACVADATPDGLRRVREKHGLLQPLVRYAPVRRAA